MTNSLLDTPRALPLSLSEALLTMEGGVKLQVNYLVLCFVTVVGLSWRPLGELTLDRRLGAQLQKSHTPFGCSCWLGRDSHTDEHTVGSNAGISRTRTVRRLPQDRCSSADTVAVRQRSLEPNGFLATKQYQTHTSAPFAFSDQEEMIRWTHVAATPANAREFNQHAQPRRSVVSALWAKRWHGSWQRFAFDQWLKNVSMISC